MGQVAVSFWPKFLSFAKSLLRILHVIPSVAAVRGGPSQGVLEMVPALCRWGAQAEIVTTNDNGPGLLDVPCGERIAWQGAPTWFFRRFSPPVRSLREFAVSFDLTRWLRRHVQDYDLIHVHALFSYSCAAAMQISRKARVPFVNRPSGLLCRWSLQQSRARKKLFLALFDRANLNASAAIEYTAEQERNEAAVLGLRPPAFVLPYGLHIPQEVPNARESLRRQLNVASDEPIILFLSRLHPKKNAHDLLAALQRISNRAFTLIIAGSGSTEYESRLKSIASSGSLAGRVRFVGFAQDEYKQLLLQGSDLFALPSHSESFGIAALEAIAAGIPVLLTPEVPLASLVEKFRLGWVSQNNPEAICKSVIQMLDGLADSETRLSRRARARRLVLQNYTWEQIAKRLLDVYRAILAGEPPPSFELAKAQI